MLTHTDTKHVPYLLPNRETLTWQEFGFFFLKLGLKKEDDVSGGLRRSGNMGFGPSHVTGDTQQGKKGRGRLVLKFDMGSFHFYSITYHSGSQRIAV